MDRQIERERAALLAELGARLTAKAYPAEAAMVLAYAATLDPGCFSARFGRAEALEALGRYDESLAELWLAYGIASAAAGPPPLILLAEESAARARLSEAPVEPLADPAALARSLGLAAAQRPGEAWLAGRIGGLWMDAGSPAEAVPWCRRAAALDPGHADDLARALKACGGEREARLALAGISDTPDLRDAVRRLPLPSGAEIRCEPLVGGAQNVVLKLSAGDRQFALRLEKFPSAGWSFYPEEHNNAVAAHATGVAPRIFYFDSADGTQLAEFLPGGMMHSTLLAMPAKAAEVGALYRRLHATAGFRGNYDLLGMIESDRRDRRGFTDPLLPGLSQIEESFAGIAALLTATKGPSCATHNDPIPQNFVEGADGLRLLDWQCSALGDPHWEIGAFSIQTALPEPAEQAFFDAYFDPGDRVGRARARLFAAVCCFFWLGRALIRGARGQDATWRDEAVHSAKNFRALLAQPPVTQALALLRRETGT